LCPVRAQQTMGSDTFWDFKRSFGTLSLCELIELTPRTFWPDRVCIGGFALAHQTCGFNMHVCLTCIGEKKLTRLVYGGASAELPEHRIRVAG